MVILNVSDQCHERERPSGPDANVFAFLHSRTDNEICLSNEALRMIRVDDTPYSLQEIAMPVRLSCPACHRQFVMDAQRFVQPLSCPTCKHPLVRESQAPGPASGSAGVTVGLSLALIAGALLLVGIAVVVAVIPWPKFVRV